MCVWERQRQRERERERERERIGGHLRTVPDALLPRVTREVISHDNHYPEMLIKYFHGLRHCY